MKPFHLASLLSVLLSTTTAPNLSASEPENSSSIFPTGSAIAGKTLFVDKGCYQCHIAGDIKLPTAALDDVLLIELGGREHTTWSREAFAKSIMNPNHTVSPEYEKAMIILGDKFKAANSPMPGFNELLTVSDLINITTFLESLSD